MKFELSDAGQDDATYVWSLDMDIDGTVCLKVHRKGEQFKWYVFSVRSKDGKGHLSSNISPKLGLPLGPNGTLKLD